ncbi:MAG: hypothetical protein N2578_01705 [Bdellovibrionaceae bacterium]|nr:hypothetical protein [Pseudobdellovibrionaceae bacterium]
MKLFGVLFVLFYLSAPSFALVPVTGTIVNLPTGKGIELPEGKQLVVRTENEDIRRQISYLEAGDVMAGTGRIEGRVITLEGLDFVGLRKVLGYWTANETLVNFSSFSDVRVIAFQKTPENSLRRIERRFKYSLSPGSGREWIIFVSDDQSTLLGSISVRQSSATVRFFNPETGELEDSFTLRRVQ